MARNECPNCGNIINADEKDCKYCGTVNDSYAAPRTLYIKQVSQNLTESQTREVKTLKAGSVFTFIVLLFLFWPIAILYALINFRK